MPTTQVARRRATRSSDEKAELIEKYGERLYKLIPKMAFAEDYVSRSIGGVADINLLRYARKACENVLLFGPTGPGKTKLVFAYAATDKLPLVTLPCNGAIEPGQAFGQPRMLPDRTIVFEESNAVHAIRYGGILYFDEVNMMPPKIAAVFHSLLDERRHVTLLDKGGEVIVADSSTQIVGAYNPSYQGTRRMNEAFKNRWAVQLEIDYDRKVEEELVFMAALLDLADQLRQSYRQNDLETPVATNMLIKFEQFCVDISYEFAVENFLNHFNAGAERNAVRDVFEQHSATIAEQFVKMKEAAANT